MKSGPFFRVTQKHPKGEVSQGSALQSHSIQQLGMIEDVLCSLFYGGGTLIFLKCTAFFVGGEMREEHRDRSRDTDKKNRNMMFPFSP